MATTPKVWAIADLHLSFGVPDKAMDLFGDVWTGYSEKIKENWHNKISANDLVLIAGDISWAMHPPEAKADLDWIDALPGTKVLLRGNHDYWWTSLSKVEKILPPTIHLIQNNAFFWNDIGIAGSRLWDSPDYNFGSFIDYKPNERANPLHEKDKDTTQMQKIYERELVRLELSLKCLNQKPNSLRLAMTHYPPISANLQPSPCSLLFEKYNIHTCVFGHLHNVKKNLSLFGQHNNINYILTSCDYINFDPVQIV